MVIITTNDTREHPAVVRDRIKAAGFPWLRSATRPNREAGTNHVEVICRAGTSTEDAKREIRGALRGKKLKNEPKKVAKTTKGKAVKKTARQ